MESRRPQKLFSDRERCVDQFSGPCPDRGNGMYAGIYDCPSDWGDLLPEGVRRLREPGALAERVWSLLALTAEGCRRLEGKGPLCRVLLAPGDCPPSLLTGAETVVSYGMSPRDSLTLSSLAEPVLCVQRALPRPDGTLVEPQEVPLPPLPAPAEVLLPLLGLRLLHMPLTESLLL